MSHAQTRRPAVFDLVKLMTAKICDLAEAKMRVTRARQDVGMEDFEGGHLFTEDDLDGGRRVQRYLTIQPLFRAVAVAMFAEDFTYKAFDKIAQTSVYIILTGSEQGLTAPVTFEPIAGKILAYFHTDDGVKAARTSLETAYDFVMQLESRETAAFGPRPDLVEAGTGYGGRNGGLMNGESLLGKAKELGWDQEEHGPLSIPSSRWLDPDVYPDRFGKVAYNEKYMMTAAQSHRYLHAVRVAEPEKFDEYGFFLLEFEKEYRPSFPLATSTNSRY